MSLGKRVLLAVLAHPDDESFGPGGTLALYSNRGVEVHLICATRGEVGTVSPEFMQGHDSVAELRETELRCAAQHLGLAGVHFLGYRDSGMPGTSDNEHPNALAATPVEEVAARITHYIRELKPQVLLTFDPVGGYRHPDHIAVHRATVLAFHAAGDPNRFPSDLPPHQPDKLYYHTFQRRLFGLIVRLMPLFGMNPRKWGRNQDIDLIQLTSEVFPIHARIDYRAVRQAREKAAACHASQLDGGPPSRGPVSWIFRLLMPRSTDTFTRAVPPAPPGLAERDLFEGLHVRNTQPTR